MKKILFIIPSLRMGGMEKVLVNYSNLFISRGYEVTVYNLTSDDKAIVDNFDSKVIYHSFYQPVKHLFKSDIKSILTGNFRILPFYKWLAFHSSRYLHKKYVKDYFDAEIAFYGDGSAMIVNGCENNNAKKAVFFHNNNLYGFYSKHTKHYKRMSKILKNIDFKICVSDVVRADFVKTFGEMDGLVTINNPVEAQKIRIQSEESITLSNDAFTFINVSRLDDNSKGFIRLLSVCDRLKRENYKFNLWIVGSGQDESVIIEKAKELKLDNVLFLGQQSNPYKFMSKADMYICSSFHEGFSMSMVESLTLGLPMLSTEVSGAREMMGDSEYGLIVENSEEGLYEGMKNILTDKALYEHYKEKAKKRVDYFSEDKIMNKLEKLLFGE